MRLPEHLPLPGAALGVVAGLSLMAGPAAGEAAAGSEGPIGQAAGRIACQAASLQDWSRLSAEELNAASASEFAQALAVKPSRVRNGLAGQVHCNRSVTADQLYHDMPVVTVKGAPKRVGRQCVMAFLIPRTYAEKRRYRDVYVLCPANLASRPTA